MKPVSQAGAREYLQRHGIAPAQIDEVLSGFDFRKPVYEQFLAPDDILFQFIRKPSFSAPSSFSGNWFCLAGAKTSDLAIIDGVAGRRLHRYRVIAGLIALEGTAARMDVNWDWAGGGAGGATQIYVPPSLIGHMQAVGAHES